MVILTANRKKRAEIYDRIASYYESLGKEDKSGEKATAGYSNFFKDLVELNKNELTDMGNNTTAITLYNEIANQIGANASNFFNAGCGYKRGFRWTVRSHSESLGSA